MKGEAAGSSLYPSAVLVGLFGLLVRLALIGTAGYAPDLVQFAAWAEISRSGSEIAPPGGLAVLYDFRPGGGGWRWCNYPPGYVLALRMMGPVYDALSPEGERLGHDVVYGVRASSDAPGVHRLTKLLKLPAVSADAVLAGLLCIWIGRRAGRNAGIAAGVLYALAPPVVFTSAVWGQVDSVFVLPMLASLECARRGRVAWMAFWASIAVLIKAQALMVAPIWIMFALRHAAWDARRWALLAVAAALPAAVVLLPFRGAWDGAWEAYARAASFYPYTHLNGFSGWFLLHPMLSPALETMEHSYVRDAGRLLMGMTARDMGLSAVLVTWAIVAWVLHARQLSAESVSWAARILPIAFFFFSTQMHERYLLPAVGLWLWAFRNDGQWRGLFTIVVIVATLNLWWFWSGHGENTWTTLWHDALRRPWLGYTSGQWCATGLFVVLVMTAFEQWSRKRKTPEWPSGVRASVRMS